MKDLCSDLLKRITLTHRTVRMLGETQAVITFPFLRSKAIAVPWWVQEGDFCRSLSIKQVLYCKDRVTYLILPYVDKLFPSWCEHSFTVQLHLFTCFAVPGTAKNSLPRFIGWYVYSGLASPNVFFPEQTPFLLVLEVYVAVLPCGFCSLTRNAVFLPLPSYQLETLGRQRMCTEADKSLHYFLRSR